MPRHPFTRPKGSIDYLEISSKALANNVLGDPTTRTVALYLPEGYDETDDRYPLMVDVVAIAVAHALHGVVDVVGSAVGIDVDELDHEVRVLGV